MAKSEAVYLRKILAEVCEQQKFFKIYVEKQSFIKIAENPEFHYLTKQIIMN